MTRYDPISGMFLNSQDDHKRLVRLALRCDKLYSKIATEEMNHRRLIHSGERVSEYIERSQSYGWNAQKTRASIMLQLRDDTLTKVWDTENASSPCKKNQFQGCQEYAYMVPLSFPAEINLQGIGVFRLQSVNHRWGLHIKDVFWVRDNKSPPRWQQGVPLHSCDQISDRDANASRNILIRFCTFSGISLWRLDNLQELGSYTLCIKQFIQCKAWPVRVVSLQ